MLTTVLNFAIVISRKKKKGMCANTGKEVQAAECLAISSVAVFWKRLRGHR